jgi:DNA-binding NarL/FixJ family response regulator
MWWLSVWRGARAAAIVRVMTDPAPALPVTCLIVDDSAQFFEAARQLLADDGVTVVGFAATSDEAVHETLALRPDVVLVDVDLGAESGFDVAKRLAGLPRGGPPVVLISAESGTELAELVGASGALGFISKTDLSGDSILELLARNPED